MFSLKVFLAELNEICRVASYHLFAELFQDLRACHCLGFRLFDGAFIWGFACFFLTFLSFGGCVDLTLLLEDLVPFAAFQVLLFLLEIREEAIQDRLALLERLCLV